MEPTQQPSLLNSLSSWRQFAGGGEESLVPRQEH
jgi:hypothetical protein